MSPKQIIGGHVALSISVSAPMVTPYHTLHCSQSQLANVEAFNTRQMIRRSEM